MANKWSMNHFDGSQTMSSKRLQLCSCCFCDWVVSHKAGQASGCRIKRSKRRGGNHMIYEWEWHMQSVILIKFTCEQTHGRTDEETILNIWYRYRKLTTKTPHCGCILNTAVVSNLKRSWNQCQRFRVPHSSSRWV